jgi:3,4-dihydroxy 2-butanone 4-phosphate synthase/GTP cyclohydrolase II
MPGSVQFDSVEDAIADIKNGKIIVVVDDENRENEGDFIAAAECVTPEMINFMAQHGRGLICTPITESYCRKLDLYPMVNNNTDPMGTAFTVSVDLKGNGVTSGISAADRSKTVKHLIDEQAKPEDFIRPGHVFPLTAKEGGVLRRTGHTEAAIDFARLAGFKPAGVIVEIMNSDGTMARLPELRVIADELQLKLVSIESLVAYRMKFDSLVEKVEDYPLETKYGTFQLQAFKQNTNQQIHIALTRGNWSENDKVLTRIQSLNMTQNILQSLQGNDENEMDNIFKHLVENDYSCMLFINKIDSNKSVEILHEIKPNSTENSTPTMDDKDFGIGAQILHQLKIQKLSLLSNSDQIKRVGLAGYGLEIVEYVGY